MSNILRGVTKINYGSTIKTNKKIGGEKIMKGIKQIISKIFPEEHLYEIVPYEEVENSHQYEIIPYEEVEDSHENKEDEPLEIEGSSSYEITSYIWSNLEDVERARKWLDGERPIPDINNAVDILGDIESFDIRGW